MSRNTLTCLIFSLFYFANTPGSAQSNKPLENVQVPSAATVRTSPTGYTSGIKVNYIRSREAIKKTTDESTFISTAPGVYDVTESTKYLDGLGRELQKIDKRFGVNGSLYPDLVTPNDFDRFGRQVYQYLPYSASTDNGNFKLNAYPDQKSFNEAHFSGEQVFYSKTIYENSPLNRILKTFAPGNNWAGTEGTTNERCIQNHYLVNSTDDSVRVWSISYNSLSYSNEDQATNIPVSNSSEIYSAGQLYKNIVIDENGTATVEYKDKNGLTVLKKVQIDSVPTNYGGYENFLCTYYIYDELGRLRFVLPPKAVNAIKSNWTLSGDVINELCFRYEYDSQGRMVAKKVPGSGWQYIVFDSRDRPVFSQDANLRAANKWMATMYDQINRVVVTGMITYSGNPSDLQEFVDNSTSESSFLTFSIPAPTDLYVNHRESGQTLYRAQHEISFTSGFNSESSADFTAEISDNVESTEIIRSIQNALPPNHNLIVLTINYYDNYNCGDYGQSIPAFRYKV